ncbi:MAG TPA: hypothetical protein VK970_20380, partial [Candidatus Methylacidiphilales bacterium]|nr:hypothetical protein [Candidatus Methylacidiphilales bacterium]
PGSLLGDSSVALSVMHYSNALPQSRLALIPKSIPVFVPINVCEWSYSTVRASNPALSLYAVYRQS